MRRDVARRNAIKDTGFVENGGEGCRKRPLRNFKLSIVLHLILKMAINIPVARCRRKEGNVQPFSCESLE